MRTLRRESATFRSHSFAGRILLLSGTPTTGQEVNPPARPDATLSGRPAGGAWFPSHWRSLDYFNLYRLTLAAALSFLSLLLTQDWPLGGNNPGLFRVASFSYLLATALFIMAIRARWPSFPVQLSIQIVSDITIITLLAYASGGVKSGLGLLLLVPLSSAGLTGNGRLALFYAALASLAMLALHTFGLLRWQALAGDYLQVALLSSSFFLVAWLAHILTQRALVSERAALERAVQLDHINRIHAVAAGGSPDGMLSVDASGRIRYSNPQSAKLLGLLSIAPGTALQEVAPALDAPFAAWQKRDGADIASLPDSHVRVRFLPLGDRSEAVVVLEDPGRASALAQQIKLAALGRLTLSIAHEIRNPLSAIGHAAQLLAEDNPHDGTAKLTGIIRGNVARLDQMVQDILSLNRRDRQARESLDIAPFVVAWIREWQQAEEIPENAVIMDMSESATLFFAPQHLRQILWNLARNAWRHASRRAGCLRISLRRQENMLVLEILDDGPGVSKDNQPRLFEPFYTTDAQGTGLGLYIARELAESNQARLEFAGNRPGACFLLSIPLQSC